MNPIMPTSVDDLLGLNDDVAPDSAPALNRRQFLVLTGMTGLAIGLLNPRVLASGSVEPGSELTELIQTQPACNLNARVIRTVDEMLQESTNMKR